MAGRGRSCLAAVLLSACCLLIGELAHSAEFSHVDGFDARRRSEEDGKRDDLSKRDEAVAKAREPWRGEDLTNKPKPEFHDAEHLLGKTDSSIRQSETLKDSDRNPLSKREKLQENQVAEVVARLKAEGRKVERNPDEGVSGKGRQADLVVDGKKIEVKTISNVENKSADGLSSAIASRVMDARGQARDVIVDATNQEGMSRDIAERGINRALGRDAETGEKIDSIRVVGKDFDLIRNRNDR